MNYEKYNWQTGQVITAQKLNHIEDGLYDSLFSIVTANEDGSINATFEQVKQEIDKGKVVYVKYPITLNNGEVKYAFLNFFSKYNTFNEIYDRELNVYKEDSSLHLLIPQIKKSGKLIYKEQYIPGTTAPEAEKSFDSSYEKDFFSDNSSLSYAVFINGIPADYENSQDYYHHPGIELSITTDLPITRYPFQINQIFLERDAETGGVGVDTDNINIQIPFANSGLSSYIIEIYVSDTAQGD